MRVEKKFDFRNIKNSCVVGNPVFLIVNKMFNSARYLRDNIITFDFNFTDLRALTQNGTN